MQGDQGNVRSNIMCTYSWSCASKEVSKTHHMHLLTVTCNKINISTCSIRNTASVTVPGQYHNHQQHIQHALRPQLSHRILSQPPTLLNLYPSSGKQAHFPCYGHYKLIHLFCCTWPWVNACDVSRILPYLHVTVSKYTWYYFGHFLCFNAHDCEYIVLYFDTITWLVMIG